LFVGGLLTYDLRNIVKRAPRLTLAINLLAAPVAIGWLWMALSFDFPRLLTMSVIIAWLAVTLFFALLMIETFENTEWLILFIELILVYFWIASLIKLIQVVRGEADFPPLKP
jgi:hypothetical protein